MSTNPRIWLITGSSSGIGRRMVEFALEQGDKVVATLRTPSALEALQQKYTSDSLLIVQLDVTDASQIAHAFAEAKHAFGRVDIVFNNAGVGVVGEIESVPESAARKLFDVNFWGMINVSKEAVRFFREENGPEIGGRLLVVGSSSGINPAPAVGYYSASKFALEAINQVLSEEIDPDWNIKITILELGFVRTDLADKSEVTPAHPAYDKPTNRAAVMRKMVLGQFDANTAVNVSSLDKVVSRIFDASRLEEPPLRLPLGAETLVHAQAQMKRVSDNFEEYKAWAEGLLE